MLGLPLHANLILIDERKGVAVARQKGFEITSTLGIVVLAARRNLVDLAEAFARLRQTGFYWLRKNHGGTFRQGSQERDSMKLIGYARVSTEDQNIDRPKQALEAAGCAVV